MKSELAGAIDVGSVNLSDSSEVNVRFSVDKAGELANLSLEPENAALRELVYEKFNSKEKKLRSPKVMGSLFKQWFKM